MQKLLILGIVLAVASAAFAYPTAMSFTGGALGGPTGGFNVPTADTANGFVVAIDRYEDETAEWPSTQLLWGAMPNLEVGAGYIKLFGNTIWDANAKYALPINFAGGKLAIGAGYFKNQTAGGKVWDAYLAGTWPIKTDLKFTGNLYYMKTDTDSNTDLMLAVAKQFLNSQLGVELDLNPAGDQGVSMDVYDLFQIKEGLFGRVALAGLGQSTTWNLSIGYASANVDF